MDSSLLTAREIPNGYTWTLSSRLGDMLFHAEKMFGERDKTYTILGIEFMETGPRIWYPKNNKSIVIQLTPEALNAEEIALYQLAHESVHLLSPSGSANANVLEEGVAVWFSWWYLKQTLKVDGEEFTKFSKNYFTAGLLVEKAMNHNPLFFKQARIIQPEIWKITKEEIKSLCSILSDDEAQILAAPFSTFTKTNTERLYSSQV